MTDQAVDNGGTKVSAEGQRPAAGSAPTESQFLGRTRELKELRADIERAGLDTISGRKAPRARVLLIAGKPGSGRTALAEELAEQVAESYPDGVLRARLTEPDGTPVPTERTARELLTALERPTPPGAGAEDLGESLREALAVRRVLLVLDDAADAEQVDALLPDTPECLVVAVSGGPLTGIADVRPCTLGGLDTKSALELLGRFTGSVRITVDPFAAEGWSSCAPVSPPPWCSPAAGSRPALSRPSPTSPSSCAPTARRARRWPVSSGSRTPRCPAPPRGYCDCCRSPRPVSSTRTPRPRSRAAR